MSTLPYTCYLSRELVKNRTASQIYFCDLCDFGTTRLDNIIRHHRQNHSPLNQLLPDQIDATLFNNVSKFVESSRKKLKMDIQSASVSSIVCKEESDQFVPKRPCPRSTPLAASSTMPDLLNNGKKPRKAITSRRGKGTRGRGRYNGTNNSKPGRNRTASHLPSLESSDESDASTMNSTWPLPNPRDLLEDVPVDVSGDSDDGEELPDILSSSQQVSDILKEGDLLWVKTSRCPFLPVVVKKVYYQRRKLNKLSVGFISSKPEYRQSRRLSSHGLKKNVIRFGGNYEQQMRLIAEAKATEFEEMVCDAVDLAEEYLIQLANGKMTQSALQFFGFKLSAKEESESASIAVSDGIGEVPVTSTTEPQPETTQMDVSDNDKPVEIVSQNQQNRRRRQETQSSKLLEFTASNDMKDHLKKIIDGTIRSSLHDEFMSKTDISSQGKASSFGLEDDNMQDKLMDTILNHYNVIKASIMEHYKDKDYFLKAVFTDIYKNMQYFIQVVYPEAVIFAIEKSWRRSRNDAEFMFNQGMYYGKEELSSMGLDKLSLTAEQRESVNRRIERLSQKYGITL